MNIIMESLFGSHLYGLNTPSSDLDYKGMILPSKTEILLGNSKYHIDASTGPKNSKNSSTDIDKSYYTLSYFIDLACKGETVCIDLLNGSDDKLIVNSEIWQYMKQHRDKFYTKSMKAYIGYIRKQAAKYGIKGSRISELENILAVVQQNLHAVVGDVEFPESEFGQWIEYKGNRYYEFAGSKFQDNLQMRYMNETLMKIYKRYGERSIAAKNNEGIDFKAIHHGLRAGFQARDIFLHGSFEYPLKESAFLMQVKNGELDFLTEIEPEFAKISNEVLLLAEQSTYPETADTEFWNNFICDVHYSIISK
jgi:predicted nucleotidyltransferase